MSKMKTIYEYKINEDKIFNELHREFMVSVYEDLALPVIVYTDDKHAIRLSGGVYLVIHYRDGIVACTKSLAELKDYIVE